MGLIIKNELDTSIGTITDLYAVVTQYRVHRRSGQIRANVEYFTSKQNYQLTLLKYIGETQPNNPIDGSQLLVEDVVCYDKKDKPTEVKLPIHLDYNFSIEKEVEIPIFEIQRTEEEVPYISFDKDGNEIKKLRNTIRHNQVQVGVDKKIENVIDWGLVENPLKFIYTRLKEDIQSLSTNFIIEEN